LGLFADVPFHGGGAGASGGASRLPDAQAMLDAPLQARLVVPRRALAWLPAPIRPSGVRGDLDLALDVSGTARAPPVRPEGHALGLEGTEERATPVDVDLTGDYDAAVARLNAVVQRKGRAVLGGDVVLSFPFAQLHDEHRRGAPRWKADAAL